MSNEHPPHTPKDVHIGDGTESEFVVSFPYDRAADLFVFQTETDGTEVRQLLNKHYTFRTDTDTLKLRSPLAADVVLTIMREQPIIQPSGRNAMSADVFRKRLDSLTQTFQQLRERGDRTLHIGQPYPPLAVRSNVYPAEPPAEAAPLVIFVVGGPVLNTGLRSEDGINYTAVQISDGFRQWRDITYNPVYESFYAVTTGWVTRSDITAMTWVESNQIAEFGTVACQGIDTNPNTGTMIIAHGVFTGGILRCTDGETFESVQATPTAAAGVRYIAFLDAWIVGMSGGGSSSAYVSFDDGATWDSVGIAAETSGSYDFADDGNAIINADGAGGGAARTWLTTDLETFGDTAGPFFPYGGTRKSATWGNGKFLKVGGANDFSGGDTSADGALWSHVLGVLPFYSWLGSTYVQQLGMFIITGVNFVGGGFPAIRYSADGLETFTTATFPSDEGQAYWAITSNSPAVYL